MKSVLEEELRAVIARHRRAQWFTLRDARVEGRGLGPDVAEACWAEIRDLSYGDPLSADRDFSRFPQIKATNPLV
jgi:hypothetical protein